MEGGECVVQGVESQQWWQRGEVAGGRGLGRDSREGDQSLSLLDCIDLGEGLEGRGGGDGGGGRGGVAVEEGVCVGVEVLWW